VSNTDPAKEKIRFRCTGCGVKLAAPHKHVGASIRCPKCKLSLTVPEASETGVVIEKMRADWSLARCPSCEEVTKVRAANRGIPVACPSCESEMIVSLE